MSEEVEYGLIIPFTDASPSYCNGFRAGEVWGRMAHTQPEIKITIEPENEEVYKQIAGHWGYVWEITETEMPEWRFAKFTKSKPRLGVVK